MLYKKPANLWQGYILIMVVLYNFDTQVRHEYISSDDLSIKFKQDLAKKLQGSNYWSIQDQSQRLDLIREALTKDVTDGTEDLADLVCSIDNFYYDCCVKPQDSVSNKYISSIFTAAYRKEYLHRLNLLGSKNAAIIAAKEAILCCKTLGNKKVATEDVLDKMISQNWLIIKGIPYKISSEA